MIRMIIRDILSPWTWKMAWRDSRGQRGRIMLSLSCIVLGIAALVALRSFSENVSNAIQSHSRELLGADLVLCSRQPFPAEVDRFMLQVPGKRAEEIRFSTMAFFPNNESSRLVQIRAIEGEFPFYGSLDVKPSSAVKDFRKGAALAIVEESLFHQFDLQIGGPVRVGEQEFIICGKLNKIPGETIVFSQLAPRILISKDYLKKTQLIQFGSRVFYRRHMKYILGFDDHHLFARLHGFHERFGITYDTVDTRQESLGKRFSNLFTYLNLVGLAALVLGGIGIGNSIHLYIHSKLKTIGILRCLGTPVSLATAIYVLQTLGLGCLGGFLGAILGVGVQYSLPLVFADFLPFSVDVELSWISIGFGMVAGTLVTLIFSLIPLFSIRHISPLRVIQSSDSRISMKKDPIRLLGYFMIGVCVFSISLFSAEQAKQGLINGGSLLGVFLILSILSRFFTWCVQKLRWSKLPFVFRQGLSNLYRPQNQTWLLILSIGLGTFLVMVLYLSEILLIRQFQRSSGNDSPNMVLFDIQVDQVERVEGILKELDVPILHRVPIVTMRLSSINGTTVEEIRRKNPLKREEERIPNWALNREYRSTYRDHLVSSETLVEGTLEKWTPDMVQPIPISLEKSIAENLLLKRGDLLEFDVQGIPITTRIASIRQVDWYRVQPNFFVVFPFGILEEAPQMLVVVTHVSSSEQSAGLQQEIVKTFPNVSVVDLTLVVDTISSLLDKVKLALEFMALFSILSGLLVLVTSITNSRYQRIRENAILKVLGASHHQIRNIQLIEFLTLGFLSVNIGNVLAIAGSWMLAKFVFGVEFILDWNVLIMANSVVGGIIVVIGFLGNRQSYHQSTLHLLSKES